MAFERSKLAKISTKMVRASDDEVQSYLQNSAGSSTNSLIRTIAYFPGSRDFFSGLPILVVQECGIGGLQVCFICVDGAFRIIDTESVGFREA